MTKRRALIFSTAYYPYVGGAEVAIKEITDRLSDEYEWTLITAQFSPALPKVEQIGAVSVYRIGIGIPLLDKLWLPWGGALRAVSFHRARPFDFFWCMMATYGSGAAYIANFFLHPKVPIVLTLQEGDSEKYLRWKWAGMVDLSWRLALSRATFVTAISTYLGKRARRLGFRSALEIVPNAVDTELFSKAYSDGELQEARERLGKKTTDVFLITTSRLVRKNAVDDVIRALPHLPQYVHFAVLGVGPLQAKLATLARKMGVEQRVHFLGFVEHASLPAYLRASDIFIRPSRSEGMGNSFIEAMAAGLPVIATQEGGLSDFLFDAKRNLGIPPTGWAVDKDSPRQIAAAVQEILAQREQAEKTVANAKKLVKEKYEWANVSLRMSSVFRKASGRESRMKVVIATPLYPPEIGGPATYAKLLHDNLPASGIDVVLVKFSDVRPLPKLVRHWAYYRRVRREAKNASVILALDPVSVGLPAMKAAQKARKPFAVKIVGDYAWEQGRQRFGVEQSLDEFVRTPQRSFFVRHLQHTEALVARSAAKIIVPSLYLKGIVTAWGIPEGKVHVIHNAVKIEAGGAVPESVARLPRPLVVTAGRLVPWKHVEGLIEAVRNLRQKGKTVSLAVVGDGPERAKLEKLAEGLLQNDFVFTGELSHSDTAATMAAANAFVLNSSYEGLSHALIEALTLGLPIIATRVGGNTELITDGENGLLIPHGNVSELAAALMRVCFNEETAARLASGAEESGKRFSEDAMLAETAALLSSV
ncbi:glycosyltransferase family 4 protein [Candidatus Kaiserbacteria bacterium]|nr:glycosyltransferase family 4 protein [Candidatus Kaiserbacteria bacterium]